MTQIAKTLQLEEQVDLSHLQIEHQLSLEVLMNTLNLAHLSGLLARKPMALAVMLVI
jgi:hypothetical protein